MQRIGMTFLNQEFIYLLKKAGLELLMITYEADYQHSMASILLIHYTHCSFGRMISAPPNTHLLPHAA